MKYLVLFNAGEAALYAHLLIDEILRYDIRAQIFVSNNGHVKEYSASDDVEKIPSGSTKINRLSEYSFDLSIIVGSSFSKRLVRKIRPSSSKVCFFQITKDFDAGYKTCLSAATIFDKVFIDLPYEQSSDNIHHIGSYQNDLIRKHDFEADETDGLNIGILFSRKRNFRKLAKLIEELATHIRDGKWNMYSNEEIQSNLPEELQLSDDKLNLLKTANAVIVDSEEASITAALMNCPQISISGKYGLFGFSSTRKLLVNQITGKDTISGFKPSQYHEIKGKLHRLINDHEYCASMLTDYQEFKEKLGTNPVARTAVQIIIEWIEK